MINIIEVKIIGEAGTGKTTLALLIKNTFENIGIICNIKDPGITEENLKGHSFQLSRALSSIADSTIVKIETIQTRKVTQRKK
jgi:ABC-type glutathione transport system ATPase component